MKLALDAQTCITCTELVAHVMTVMSLSISRSLILNVVHSLGYSFKRVKKRGLPSDVEGHAVGVQRFLTQYEALRSKGTTVVSVDESGFDHRARPFYGFAPRGQPAVVSYAANSERTRYNLLMAVANTGERWHAIRPNTVSSVTFANFIDTMPFPVGSVLLLDNAPVHKPYVVKEALARKGYVPLFLPAYSPQFQPVELVFGRLKAAYYKERLRASRTIIARCVEQLVAAKCTADFVQRCFAHVDGVVMATVAARA